MYGTRLFFNCLHLHTPKLGFENFFLHPFRFITQSFDATDYNHSRLTERVVKYTENGQKQKQRAIP